MELFLREQVARAPLAPAGVRGCGACSACSRAEAATLPADLGPRAPRLSAKEDVLPLTY